MTDSTDPDRHPRARPVGRSGAVLDSAALRGAGPAPAPAAPPAPIAAPGDGPIGKVRSTGTCIG